MTEEERATSEPEDTTAEQEKLSPQQEKNGKSKKKVIAISVGVAVVAIAIAAICFWYFQFKVPYDQAVENYNAAIENYRAEIAALEERSSQLESDIASLQTVIDSEEQPLDEALLTSAGAIIGEAQGARALVPEIPEMPTETEAINRATTEINTKAEEVAAQGNYSQILAELADAQETLETSIQQMNQVTNPTEQFVIERIQGLPSIAGVQAVTEDHDPNGNLNKQGGYTATVYFSSDLIDQSEVFGDDIVDKATEGGGAVEVYRTVEEAEARDTYLSAFDGGILSSGSHVVCGTVVIRTSNLLTASQQQALTDSIREALIEIR
ncbi:MAG: hypothetical protein LBI64_03095 [Coriobacteriales bacterium]|jgi:uncharacterized protein YoxC|nr:hypothetical protein [Coriobacteriales bacterium]